MDKQLIFGPLIPFEIPTAEQITESMANNDGKLVFKTKLQVKDEQNQNGRRYPGKILEREVNKYMSMVKGRSALGELDHPNRNEVSMAESSHVITEMWWEDDALYGKVEVLNDTPKGKIMESLIRHRIPVGMSSRGVGSTKKIRESDGKSYDEVQEDFELVCWDAVSNPSVRGAWLMKEGVEAGRDNAIINEIDESINEILCWDKE